MPNHTPSRNAQDDADVTAWAGAARSLVDGVSGAHWPSLRVAITGGTGFIGARLIQLLIALGVGEVRVLCRREQSFPLPARSVRGDLADEAALTDLVAGCDLVFHLAGLTRAWTREEFFAVNADAVGRLAQITKAKAPQARFVYVGSQAAVGPAPSNEPVGEDVSPSPVSLYGQSKLAGEVRLKDEAQDELAYTILRPSAVYGPGEKDLAALFGSAHRGFVPLVGLRSRAWSFVHVDDLCAAIVAAAVSRKTRGGTYFLAHPEVVEDRRLARALFAAAERRGITVRLPSLIPRGLGLLAGFARPFRARPPLLNPDRAHEIAPRFWLCSPQRFERDAGFRFEIGIEEGARLTMAHLFPS